jgi:hypothetical protein
MRAQADRQPLNVRANVPREHLATYHFFFPDMIARRFIRAQIPGLQVADTAFHGTSTWPVTGCVRSAIPKGTSHRNLVSAGELPLLLVSSQREKVENVGRKSYSCCRGRNAGDRGGGNG